MGSATPRHVGSSQTRSNQRPLNYKVEGMSLKILMESEMEHGWQARVESTTLRIWDTGRGLPVLPWRLDGDPTTVPSDF